MFNSEKYNFKYEGYELSERKHKRNEEGLMKIFKVVKSEFEPLNKKVKGKTFGASLFGKRTMTTNETARYTKLGDMISFMNTYGELKSALSAAMNDVMKNFATSQSQPLNKPFEEATKLMEKLEKLASGKTSGGRKVKRRVSKKKSDLKKKSKKSSKSKKSKKVSKK